MAEERVQRRLAAILSTDVVGYSRLMGLDEAGTLSRLNALRRGLIDPTIAAHAGRIVKLMGDGALVEFASAVDAVTCAIEIQRQLRERDADGSEADPIRFRIGINVGDIIMMISWATASTSRLGSKGSPSPAASRFPRTPGGRCKARSLPTSSMVASRA
jgi:class 3 adenylate cyclase